MRLALSFVRAVHFAFKCASAADPCRPRRMPPSGLPRLPENQPHLRASPRVPLSPPRPRRLPNASPIPLKPVGSSPMWGLLVGKVLDLIRSTGTSMTNFAVNVGAGAHAGHACSRAMPLGAR